MPVNSNGIMIKDKENKKRHPVPMYSGVAFNVEGSC